MLFAKRRSSLVWIFLSTTKLRKILKNRKLSWLWDMMSTWRELMNLELFFSVSEIPISNPDMRRWMQNRKICHLNRGVCMWTLHWHHWIHGRVIQSTPDRERLELSSTRINCWTLLSVSCTRSVLNEVLVCWSFNGLTMCLSSYNILVHLPTGVGLMHPHRGSTLGVLTQFK